MNDNHHSLIPQPDVSLGKATAAPTRILTEIIEQTLVLARDSIVAPVDLDALVREGEKLLRSKGGGMTEENIRAFGLFLRAAEAGHGEAQYILASSCYLTGQGVPKDNGEVLKWYRKAAEHEHPHAQYTLGTYYLAGVVVPQDYQEAAKWFRKAAEGDDVAPQHHLAPRFNDGLRAMAQYKLGCCYRDGQGVPQDYVEAVKWYWLAADRGHETADQDAVVLTFMISPSELETAQRLYQEFKSQHPTP